ncbi:MAG: hypothetical protein ACRC6E_07845 [Fusobacteriaceae bacterium]
MKIFYKLINETFHGFYHLENTNDESMMLIDKEEFENLLSIGGEIKYNPIKKKLFAAILPENHGLRVPLLDPITEKYIESGTPEEIMAKDAEWRKTTYSRDLNIYSQMLLELDLGLINEEDIIEAKAYICSLHPNSTYTREKIIRPEKFLNYRWSI